MNNRYSKSIQFSLIIILFLCILTGCSAFTRQSNETGTIFGRWVGKIPVIISEGKIIFEPYFLQIGEKEIYEFLKTERIESGIEDSEYQYMGDNQYKLTGRMRKTLTIKLDNNKLKVQGLVHGGQIITFDRMIEPNWVSVAQICFTSAILANSILIILIIRILLHGGIKKTFIFLDNKNNFLANLKNKTLYCFIISILLIISGWIVNMYPLGFLINSFILDKWRMLLQISFFLFILFLGLVIILLLRRYFRGKGSLIFALACVFQFTIPSIVMDSMFLVILLRWEFERGLL